MTISNSQQIKGLESILDLFKRLKVIHKPTRFDK